MFPARVARLRRTPRSRSAGRQAALSLIAFRSSKLTAPLAAAVIFRRERDLVGHFCRAGALTPETAQSSKALGVHERLAWQRLVNRGVLRSAGSGAFYLDESAWEALRRTRRWRALVLGLLILVFAIYLAARGRSP
jgi:hypothetical protein